MKAQDLYPIIGRQDYGIAATLEQILFHWRRHAGAQPFRLSFITRFVRRSVSALSRYIQWLEREGFIRVRRERRGTAQVLFIQPLIKLRKRAQTDVITSEARSDGTAEKSAWDGDGTAMGRYTQGDTQGNTQGDTTELAPERAGSGPSSVSSMALKPPLKDALKRVEEKRERARARASGDAPTPAKIAHVWVRLLGEYGYPGFDATALKNLKHIQKTIGLFGCDTVEGFLVELERRIGLWQNTRPKLLAKTPPHPWALNRTDTLFQIEEPNELEFTLPPEMQSGNTPEVDKPKEGYTTQPPVIEQGKKTGLLGLLTGKKGPK